MPIQCWKMMRKRKEESDGVKSKTKQKIVLPVSRAPPPPPPLPKFRGFSSRPTPELSVTKREIARFWRQKRIEEEDHLLAAIKAAARLRSRNLTVRIRSIFFSLSFLVFWFDN